MTTTQTMTTGVLRAFLAAAALALAFATQSASAAGEPVEAAAGGCALQCIEKALVTPTASSAKVEIVTAVRTRVVVTVRRLSRFGRVDGPEIKAVGRFLRTSRTLKLRHLEPSRTYRISVSATDAAGHTASRSGRFTTRKVQTAGHSGPGGLSSGLGCSVKCITRAVPTAIGPTAAVFEFETNTPARITVIASLAGTGSIAAIATSPLTRSYTFGASPLYPGTRYDLHVRATDANGHTEAHLFSFRTVERRARVTFWKVQVIDDADKGVNRGELSFSYYLGGELVKYEGFTRRSSGDVFDVTGVGTSRVGLSGVLPANGPNPQLDIRVFGEECDGHLLISSCASEVLPGGAPIGGSSYWATAGGPFGLSALVPAGALPPSYGTKLPAGHNTYLVFETTQYNVKFRVFATVDFFFAW
jgi:hypothetical protein